MNSNHDHDGALLDQIDRALEYGIPAEDALINHLADTIPQASMAFQQDLEQRLMAQVASSQPRKSKEKNIMHLFASAPTMPRSTATWGTSWAFTLAAVALIAVVLLNWNNVWVPAQLASPPGQLDTPVQIVIATQDIPAGTLITTEMVGTITVPAEDFAKLMAAQPGREFLSDVAAVVEQTAAIDILWFQAIETRFLGEVADVCDLPGAKCPGIPEGYYDINLPLQPDTLQGLAIGDRVDVLASIAGELRIVTANVLLADITPTMVTLAVPSWQHSILVWLYQSRTSYALRLYTGESTATAPDLTPTEYTFTAPAALPDDYVFDLVITLPASQGYLLAGLSMPVDHIQFTGPGANLVFWFTDIEVVSIVDGTSVTIRLPQTDADILAYLIENHAEIGFIPDTD